MSYYDPYFNGQVQPYSSSRALSGFGQDRRHFDKYHQKLSYRKNGDNISFKMETKYKLSGAESLHGYGQRHEEDYGQGSRHNRLKYEDVEKHGRMRGSEGRHNHKYAEPQRDSRNWRGRKEEYDDEDEDESEEEENYARQRQVAKKNYAKSYNRYSDSDSDLEFDLNLDSDSDSDGYKGKKKSHKRRH